MIYFVEHQGKILLIPNVGIIQEPNMHLIAYVPEYTLLGMEFEDIDEFFVENNISLGGNLEIVPINHVFKMRDNANLSVEWKARQAIDDETNEILRKYVKNSKTLRKNLNANSVADFIDILDTIADTITVKTSSQILPSIFYRGQFTSSWGLLPSLFRSPEPILAEIIYMDWKDALDRILSNYESRITPYIDDKSYTKRDIAALGQHNSLPTNLLDWTTNPLIALFFACNDYLRGDKKRKSNADGAVWIAESRNYAFQQNADDASDGLFFRPRVVSRFIEAQRGWFSYHTPPEYRESFEPITEINRPTSWSSLVKITIPHHKKRNIIHHLKILGIDESAVFPSLRGIAEDIRSELGL